MPSLLERIRPKQEHNTQNELSSREIIRELRLLKQQLQDNEALFNEVLENDLIEACIYDGKALRSRYRYFHNMARRRGIRLGEL